MVAMTKAAKARKLKMEEDRKKAIDIEQQKAAKNMNIGSVQQSTARSSDLYDDVCAYSPNQKEGISLSGALNNPVTMRRAIPNDIEQGREGAVYVPAPRPINQRMAELEQICKNTENNRIDSMKYILGRMKEESTLLLNYIKNQEKRIRALEDKIG